MILSAITVSLVSEAKGGPFVFWDDLDAGFALAASVVNQPAGLPEGRYRLSALGRGRLRSLV